MTGSLPGRPRGAAAGAELPQPRTAAGRTGLDALLAGAGRSVVALDFDGTLAPIVDDPEAARAHPGAVPALRRLAPEVDAIVVITGRPAATAVEYGALGELPGNVCVLGHYGWERWQAGEITVPHPPASLREVRAALPELARAEPGTWIEEKHLAVAVHTRRCADPEGAFARLREPVGELAQRSGLALEPGRMVLEVRPPGMDKGAALLSFVAERDARAVLFAGDDLGDVPAFDAVESLRGRGVPGVTVCSSSHEVVGLSERADVVVAGPGGVVALLDSLTVALSRRG